MKKERILVIDDDIDFLDLISTILMEEGYVVDTAKSGEEAIEKCIEELYSLLLIDIKLPDFEGIHLLTRIQDTDPKMRKVILTGYPTLENAQKALNLGADVYLIKPIEVEKLLKTIEQQLKEREKEFKDRYLTFKLP